MVSRFGKSELEGFWQQHICELIPFVHFPSSTKTLLKVNAGMFSTNFTGRHYFYKIMKRSIANIDYLCTINAKEEEKVINKYGKNPILLTHRVLYYPNYIQYDNPWTNSLNGKRVLIISPFCDEFKLQMNKLNKIHSGFSLPNFYPIFFKSPLTQGGNNRFKTWKKALYYIFNNTKRLEFDIALLSCGSYGIPLQFLYKQIGKSSIYVGGDLCLLFGVYGKRWENNSFINEYWIRPHTNNKPNCYNEIEDGCYW